MSRFKQHKPKGDSAAAKAHRKHERKLRLVLILTAMISLILVGGIYQLLNSYQHRPKPKTGFQTALGIKPAAQAQDTIISNLLFSVHYYNKQFKPVAYIVNKDQTFVQVTGKEALKTDAYALVYLGAKNQPKGQYDKYNLSEFSIVTNIHDDYLSKAAAKPENAGLSQVDIVEKNMKPKDTSYGKYSVIGKSDVTINGIKYRKVRYNYIDNKYISINYSAEGYYTVQNNRPYAIEITRTDAPDQEFVASLRGLIANVSYGEKSQSATYGMANSAEKGKVDASGQGQNGANLPNELEGETALKVAAKNQPAVVRIGTSYCAAVTLLLPNKQEYMKIPLSCAVGIGSGSIVSSDGYISTNGHVTRMTPSLALMSGLFYSAEDGDKDPLVQYLRYLVDSGVMSKDQLTAMVTAVQSGDPEATNKLVYSAENIPKANMVVKNQYTQYAIQLGHDPLKQNRKGTVSTFNYGKTIVKAKYIDSDYDPYSGSAGTFKLDQATTSDVSILKIDGTNFPVLKLGSIDSLKKGDLITAIGYPAFVDDGLETKLRYTVPSVTQGHVQQIDYDSPQKVRKLVGSNTPIAAGNSGGPAITDNALMAGLNTYGASSCGDDKCFDSFSTFRDVADYKALLAKNKITLKDTSSLTTEWSDGIDAFADGKYGDALDSFTKVKGEYPAFYLADSFITQANTQIAAQNRAKMLKIGIGLAILLFIGSIFLVLRLTKKLRRHRQTGRAQGYYTMSVAQPTPATAAPPQPPQTFFAPTIPVTPPPAAAPLPQAPQPVMPQPQPQVTQPVQPVSQPIPPQQPIPQPVITQPAQYVAPAQPVQPQPQYPSQLPPQNPTVTPPSPPAQA